MLSKHLIASVQLVSGQHVTENCQRATHWVAKAAEAGAHLVLLPEYFPLMSSPEACLKISEVPLDFEHGPIQRMLRDLAIRHQIWLVGGSVPLRCDHSDKVYNALLAFSPQGDCVCRYHKIHLFDFQRGNESYNESQYIEAGDQTARFDTKWAKVGASICYDLRFPELYRTIAKQPGGMDILLMPAAFTYTTGVEHWKILLQARAIENQCYVLAASQGGMHDNGRHTFGHSMVVDPWGKILDCHQEGEGLAIATFDHDRLLEVRTQLPALKHRKIS